MGGRRLWTVVAALLTALLALGVAAPAASAHAALLSTTPQDGQVLAAAPTEATLTFGEGVDVGLGQLKVLSAAGTRVDRGTPSQTAGGRVVHIPLATGISPGSYVVIWRVISADSHPVSGSFGFSVGAPSPDRRDLIGQGSTSRPAAASRATSIALGATRFLGFAALVVLLGGAVFCLALWPVGIGRLRGLLLGAASAEAALAVLALFLEGPYAAGDGLSRTFDTGLLRAVMHTHYGTATAARVAVALAAVALVGMVGVVGATRGRAVAAAVSALGVGCALTWSAAGHGGAGSWQPLAYVVDAAHLLFVSAWVGGLVVLSWGLRRQRWSPAQQQSVLPGWSRLAALSVGVIVATGVFASFREVGQVGALVTTHYGRLLVLKDALVGLMLLVALSGRSYVRRRYTSPTLAPTGAAARVDAAARPTHVHAGLPTTLGAAAGTTAVTAPRTDPGSDAATPAGPAGAPDAAGLRRSVGVEVVLAVAVLVVTAFLVNSAPAADAVGPPYSGTSKVGAVTVAVDVSPARRGLNGLQVLTTVRSGNAQDVVGVTGSIDKAGGDRITVRPVRTSPGHYQDLDVVIPESGTYTIDLQIQTSEFDSTETRQSFTVR